MRKDVNNNNNSINGIIDGNNVRFNDSTYNTEQGSRCIQDNKIFAILNPSNMDNKVGSIE